ncbi:MAG: hypothetical protein AB1918_08810, partial [Pseudomonadota bacterium]
MSVITHTADGSCKVFGHPFAILAESEIQVFVDGVPRTTGFKIVGEGSSDGGHVDFDTAPVAGSVILLRRAGTAEVSDLDQPGFLEDKLAAGDNITITKQAGTTGETLLISGTVDGDDYLRKDQNLADLPDAAAARANLSLGSAAVLNAGTAAGDLVQLDASGRLPAVDGSQLTNIPFGRVKASDTDGVADFLETKLVAGDNVTLATVAGPSGQAVEITAATDPAVAAALADLETRGATSDWNDGLLALRLQKASGLSLIPLVDGWSDDFVDEGGISVTVYGADVCTGGSASSDSNHPNYPASFAFDDSTTNTFYSQLGASSGWLQYEFSSPKKIRRYVVFAPNSDPGSRAPRDWTFEAWDG